jgi:transketolase
MGYVALSRVRSLDSLSLLGLNQMALRVSPEALEIDKTLRKKSGLDAKRFERLRELARKRAEQPVEAKPAGDWNEKLEAMRQKYPNAYRPWAESDDKKLVELFSGGQTISVKKMTEVFGRHPGSIRARLKKHFGEDALTELQAR